MSDPANTNSWVEAGVLASVKIIPDHQYEALKELSEDSLRLFRMSIIVLSIYVPIIAFLLNSGPSAITSVVGHPIIITSGLMFLLSFGGSMTAYRSSRMLDSGAIRSSEYIDLSEKIPSQDDQELPEESLIFKYYWRKSVEYSTQIKRIRIMIYLSGYFLYSAVVFGALGLLSFYFQIPDWVPTFVFLAPILVPVVFSLLAIPFMRSDTVLLAEIDEVISEDDTSPPPDP